MRWVHIRGSVPVPKTCYDYWELKGTPMNDRLTPTEIIGRRIFVDNLLNHGGAQLRTVNFYKKDGALRSITFNPKATKYVKGTGTAKKNADIRNVFDVNADTWKSFDVKRFVSMEVDGNLYVYSEDS